MPEIPWCDVEERIQQLRKQRLLSVDYLQPVHPSQCPARGPKGYSFHLGFEKYIVYGGISIPGKCYIVDVLCKLGEKLGGTSVEMSFLSSVGIIRIQGNRD